MKFIDLPQLGQPPARLNWQAALETAQPVQVNAMLVEALGQAEKLEHEALVALSEATYELKVGNTYTTATDTYKSNNDLIHRLDKVLNSQYRDRKRTAITAAAQQAQGVPVGFVESAVRGAGGFHAYINKGVFLPAGTALYAAPIPQPAQQAQPERECGNTPYDEGPFTIAQPERAPLSDEAIQEALRTAMPRTKATSGYLAFARAIEAAHGIKQGGQHD